MPSGCFVSPSFAPKGPFSFLKAKLCTRPGGIKKGDTRSISGRHKKGQEKLKGGGKKYKIYFKSVNIFERKRQVFFLSEQR
jgi:hypothetical protein